MAKSTLDVLTEAYHLLDDKKRWTTGAAWLDEFGDETEDAKMAVQYCALGAISLVVKRGRRYPGYYEAEVALDEAAGGSAIQINDGPDGYRRIRAAFRKAIRSLGGRP